MHKIDAHLHINFNGLDATGLIRYMDKNHIEKCWLLGWEELDPPVPGDYSHLPLEDIMKAYKQYTGRIIPFYAPDPSSKDLGKRFGMLAGEGVRGCGELKVTCKWEDSRIEDYLHMLNEYGLPLVFHMEAPHMRYFANRGNLPDRALGYLWNGVWNGQAGHFLKKLSERSSILSTRMERKTRTIPGYLDDFGFLEKRLGQFPEIRFIAHGPHFWNHFASHLSEGYFYQKGPVAGFGIIDRLLGQYGNLFCDVSGNSGYYALSRDKERTGQFLARHAGKVLYGTDNLTDGRLEKLIRSLGLDDDVLNKIFYANAKKILP